MLSSVLETVRYSDEQEKVLDLKAHILTGETENVDNYSVTK